MIYKVYCEFYIKAKDQDKVEDYLNEEAGLDFTESHLLIEGVDDPTKIKKEDIYASL